MTCRVARGGQVLREALLCERGGRGQYGIHTLLHLEWGFDEGHGEAGLQMPFDVTCRAQWSALGRRRQEGWIHTMQHPCAGVVGNHTQSGGGPRGHLDCVTPYWVRLAFDNGRVKRWVGGRIVLCTINDLNLVTVKMAVVQVSICTMRHRTGKSWTYNGCFPTSPFLRIISTALR